MTDVRMKAVDTLHVSSVRPENILANEEFEVSAHIADDLEKRGLATRVKAKAPPENKAEPAPTNKTASKGK